LKLPALAYTADSFNLGASGINLKEMKLVGWNCRSMGKDLDNSTKMEYLARFMKSTNAQITFVSEIRTSRYSSAHLNSRFNTSDSFVVGGLWLLWSDEVIVSIKFFNHYMILALVVDRTANVEFALTCIYGDPHHRHTKFIWDQISSLLMKTLENQ
jgi:hypothetical protein